MHGADDVDELTRLQLVEFFQGDPAERHKLAPQLMDKLGTSTVEGTVSRVRARIGPLSTVVSERPGYFRLVGAKGQARAWAVTDDDGFITGLHVVPAQGRALGGLGYRRRRLLVELGWGLIGLVVGAGCWAATSVAGWVADFSVFVCLAGVRLVTGSQWWAKRGARRLGAVVVLGVAASCWRLAHLPIGQWGLASWAWPALLLVGAAAYLNALRPTDLSPAEAGMQWPLAQGQWLVIQGGRSLLNHHTAVHAQRGALDILALGPKGARGRRYLPERLEDFYAYGAPVLSPCEGTVVDVIEGLAESPPFDKLPGPATGNSVRIDTGSEEVTLAHLRPGTCRVAVGDRVTTGEVLGEVGNSGNSTEPHLHIHAERNGEPLRLRFSGIDRPLRRGVVVTTSLHAG